MTNVKYEYYANDYFRVNKILLICAGLWIPKSKYKIQTYLWKLYAAFTFFVYSFHAVAESIILKDTCKDMESFIKNINFAITHTLGLFKCIFWYFKQNELKDIIRIFTSDEFHYEIDDNFNPPSIMEKYRKSGIKYTMSFLLAAFLTISTSYVPLYIKTLFYTSSLYVENDNGTMIFSQRLPYYSWMPFNIDTPIKYFIGLTIQCFPVSMYAFSLIGVDGLFMTFMNFVSANLTIINGAFKSIRIRCIRRMNNNNGPFLKIDKLHNSHDLEIEMIKEMRKIVRHLQTTINVCDKLEDLFTYLTLTQILSTLFVFCTSLFLISTTPVQSTKFLSEFFYIITMGIQFILYCLFGNEVTLKGLDIPSALFECEWLESSRTFRTDMIITMIRMKRPLYLTVGKFAPLTLGTFVSVIKASYSFFAVLKKVND